MNPRYAIYYAPEPESALHELGSRWLGRDAISGEVLPQSVVPDLAELTAEPRRYGFHATLKAPFALAEGHDLADLANAVKQLCAGLSAFSVLLKVDVIDGFAAIVPAGDPLRLQMLAERCVRDLDEFRRPPTEAELARRRSGILTPQQDTYLRQWGYPHVMESFRFHMTLSRRLGSAEAAGLISSANAHFAGVLAAPVTIGAVSLFEESQPGAPFQAIRQFAFTASVLEIPS